MLSTTTDSDDAEGYARDFDMLIELAVSKFHLPPDEAEAIAADVLIASLRHSRSVEWLTGALACAIRSHLEDAE
jgi:hypothetical protein